MGDTPIVSQDAVLVTPDGEERETYEMGIPNCAANRTEYAEGLLGVYLRECTPHSNFIHGEANKRSDIFFTY